MNLKKEHQKELEGVRERLLQVMRQVIAHHPSVREKQQFAKKIGVTPATITRWERRERYFPTLANCVRACREFKIEPAYLFLGQKNGALTGEINSRLERVESDLLTIKQGIKKRIKT